LTVRRLLVCCALSFSLALAAIFAAACTPDAPRTAGAASGTETPTQTLTPIVEATQPLADTPTATIVWFPPTNTPTPFPTREVQPTPDMHPEVGPVLYEDAFEDETLWSLPARPDGRASFFGGELTLAMQPSPSRVQLVSLRQEPALTNFYAEITAKTSMCRDLDEYGFLIRATSSQDYFRFSLSCNGQARVERLLGGQASSPQPWVYAAGVPPGAPGITRLGVWAKGREMRFFINDEYLFTVSDPSLPSGTLGVFARSTGENALTVHFSDLVVYSLEP
jgi:hypothetical protein